MSCWLNPQLRQAKIWDRKYPEGAVEDEQVLAGGACAVSSRREELMWGQPDTGSLCDPWSTESWIGQDRGRFWADAWNRVG